MRGRQAGNAGEPLAPARPFAGADQRGRQQRAERDPHAGAEQALLDRVAHEKDAAERERKAADPDRPLRAEALLQAHARRRRSRWRRGWWRRCDRRGGGAHRLGFARRGRTRRGGRKGHGRRGGNRLGDRWRRRRGRLSRRTLLRHARHGRGGCAFERRQPDLDPAQLPAEPDGFHQRGDGHDREGQQQQPSTTKNTSMKPTSPKDAMLQRFPFKRTQDGSRLDLRTNMRNAV